MDPKPLILKDEAKSYRPSNLGSSWLIYFLSKNLFCNNVVSDKIKNT